MLSPACKVPLGICVKSMGVRVTDQKQILRIPNSKHFGSESSGSVRHFSLANENSTISTE